MSDRQIHISRGGEQYGPYPEPNAREMLAAGQLQPTDMAWYAGADEWKPLKDLFEADSPPSVPAEAAAADQSDPPDEDPDDPDKIHVTRRGEPIGPYSRDKAREYCIAGQLLPTDWGWHDGMDEDWKPLNDVLGLPAPVPIGVGKAGGIDSEKVNNYLVTGIIVLLVALGTGGYLLVYPKLKNNKGDEELEVFEVKNDVNPVSGNWVSGTSGLALVRARANALKSEHQIRALGNFCTDGGKFPEADKWCDEIIDEVNNAEIFISPQASNFHKLKPDAKHCHYAINVAAAGKPFFYYGFTPVGYEPVVVLFESDLGWNGSGGLEDAKKFAAERKASFLAVYFDDGTTETVKTEELDGLKWIP